MSAPAFAEDETQVLLNCKATEILNDEVLGESLDAEDASEVSVTLTEDDTLIATLGDNVYRETDGDEIKSMASAATMQIYTITHVSGLEEFKIVRDLSTSKRKSRLYVRTREKLSKPFGKPVRIANLNCDL